MQTLSARAAFATPSAKLSVRRNTRKVRLVAVNRTTQ